ncbi:hypothetical protein LDC_2478 [sediment metagenome]|uniref:Uncharacterized protein n=1 Tax=sediment metagenome TaxID=749907 RepID=D9PLQ5_9ZZZZ
MSYIVKSDTIDITDYVLDCSKVPAIERNRDFTPVISEIDMRISAKVSSLYVGVGREITIASESSQSYPFYIGYISESIYDYESRTYQLQIVSKLSDLKKYTVSYADLHSLISAGATQQQYRNPDNGGYPSVQLIWIIEKMFEQVSIELGLPTSLGEIDRFIFGGVERVIQLQHLRVDENMLYAIDQYVATNHVNIDADSEKLLIVPTFWDFFIWFVSSIGNVNGPTIGYNIRWSTSGTPKKIEFFPRDDSPITSITDDITYGRQDSNIVGDDNGYSYNVQFRNRQYYAQQTETSLADHKGFSGLGKNEVDYPANFIIMYEKYWVAPGEVLGLEDYPSYVYPAESFLYNKIQAATHDYNVKRYVTNTQVITRAKENFIDVANLEAEIIQEI